MRLVSRINRITSEMSTIDRYSQTRLINPESVLEHTGFVCFCSLMIAGELNKLGENLDIGALLSKATIHDVEETITGDISCPTKYDNPDVLHQIKKVELKAAKKVCAFLDKSEEQYLFRIWDRAKSDKEGFIVALSDKLAVVYKVQQETMLFSNQSMKNHVKGLEAALRELGDYCNNNNTINNDQLIYEILGEALEICQTVI